MKKLSLLLVSVLLTASVAGASQKSQMSRTLDFVQEVFETRYAPSEWKRIYAGWDLETEINRTKARLATSEELSLRDYQKILKGFIASTKDYHVGIAFQSTERAALPFAVRGVNGRYFLTFIDRSKLPASSFPFAVGDELVEFDGQPTSKAVNDLLAEMQNQNTPETDQALAAAYLTRRAARSALSVPKGPVSLKIKPQGTDQTFLHQLAWSYTEERVSDAPIRRGAQPLSLSVKSAGTAGAGTFPVLSRRMVAPFHAEELGADSWQANTDPFATGARKSFVPDLGKKIWESADDSAFYAYLYLNAERRMIGYVRIPSYMPEDTDKAIADFATVIGKFESLADALIIDEVNNPGGSVFYLYTLASMLSDQSLFTPRHRMSLSQKDVLEALETLDKLASVRTDEDAIKVIGPTYDGYPTSFQLATFLKENARFIVSEWNAGRALTEPYFIGGVDRINPSNQTRFTKPILVLTNELDFSGGDFFPAILQDNGRARIFGTRTAGAGGYVLEVEFPNIFGIERFTITGSIAERILKQPIENLGVQPDIGYSLTELDYQKGYRGYVQALEKALTELLQ